jgi:hypothetical protein
VIATRGLCVGLDTGVGSPDIGSDSGNVYVQNDLEVDEDTYLGDSTNDKTSIKDILRITPRASAPSSGVQEGDIYVNSTDNHIYCYLNGGWKQLD